MVLEICSNSATSALAAQEAGAGRIELCDNLGEGGTTPSYGQISLCRKLLNIQLYVIIRPRGGDFLYTDLEFEVMKEDIRICKELGVDGVVFGILTKDGKIDKKRCAELITLAAPMGATFHRAFDMCSDPELALKEIIELGFERVLTSGAKNTAIEGAGLIAKLVQAAQGRIAIMPGSGVNQSNLKELAIKTGAREFHTTAKTKVKSRMEFQNEGASMGTVADEFSIEQTNPDLVRTLKAILSEIEK